MATQNPSITQNPGITQNSGMTEQVYDGLSGLGKFSAWLFIIIACLFAICFFVGGVFFIRSDDDDKYLRVKGIVTDVNCVDISMDKDKTYKCDITVEYVINNTKYTNKLFNTGERYIKNEPISLMVKKDDYNNVQIAQTDKTTMGIVFIIISVILLGLAYLNYYLTYNYKVFAAAQGTRTIFQLFT